MPPRPGSLLGPYEILAPLGAGGMGEVYRALDPRLGREVAIKVLPELMAADADRLRRFEIEARAASALNHPNLLTVHDIGSADGHPYLVSELLEGVTLAQLLASGPLSQRQALAFAAQAARGLAAAHEKGIIHRDLKPANVFVTRDGRVKILDFGLAKFQTPRPGASSGDQTPATVPGMVIGTAYYMSPEQVRGDTLDHRSDIFSLGTMLFEMLTGRRAFGGDGATSLVETMHAVLRDDPFEGPPLALSPTLESLVRHCMDKSPELRFQSTRDLAFALDALVGTGSALAARTGPAAQIAGGRSARTRMAVAALGGALLGLIAGGVIGRLLAPAPATPVVRTLTYSGSEQRPATSPDGRTVAFVSARDGTPRIWLKELARGTEAPLTAGPDLHPRFSPDGSVLLFSRHDGRLPALYRVSVVGGEPQRVLDHAEQADFSPDGGRFAFLRTAEGPSGPVSVLGTAAGDGSGARELLRFDDPFWGNPRWSPDGKWIAVSRGGSGVRGTVWMIEAGADPGGGERRRLEIGSEGRVLGLAWSAGGSLLLAQSETLSAGFRSAPGSLRLCRQSGRCRTLFSVPNLGHGLDIASSGTAVFASESTGQNLHEEELPSTLESSTNAVDAAWRPPDSRWLTRGSASDRQPVYSPEGRWLTFSSDRSGNLDLWSLERSTGALRRLTDHPGEDWDPAYGPGGEQLVWSSNRSGGFEIWTAAADGGEPRQITSGGGDAQNPTVTADGRWIVYVAFNPEQRGLWRVRPDGSEAQRLVAGDLRHPEVSPDGSLVAYHYLEPARGELIRVVRSEDGATVPFSIQLAPGPGVGRARWLPGGRGLAFVALDERGLLGVFGQDFTPGRDSSDSRRPLGGFDADARTESFALAPAGDRLAISVERVQSFLQVVTNLPGVAPPG